MAVDRDKLMGKPSRTQADKNIKSPNRWVYFPIAALLIISVGLAIALSLQISNDKLQKPTIATPTEIIPTAVKGIKENSPASNKPPLLVSQQTPSKNQNADFLISDSLLASKPTYEDFQEEATSTSVCVGQKINVGNVSVKMVGLVDTPEYSDATIELGIVRPGEIFTLEPKEVGTFFISDTDSGDLLFKYTVKSCLKQK
jgi:hypothetical protein